MPFSFAQILVPTFSRANFSVEKNELNLDDIRKSGVSMRPKTQSDTIVDLKCHHHHLRYLSQLSKVC